MMLQKLVASVTCSYKVMIALAGTMEGTTVRRLKSYMSWVKYVVRQYGFYLLEEIRIK